MQQEQNNRFGG